MSTPVPVAAASIGTPVADRVVIQHAPPKTQTEGGLHIPDAAQTNSHEGTVVAVGYELEADLLFKPGARVLYSEFAGTEISLDGEKYIVMRKDEVLIVRPS